MLSAVNNNLSASAAAWFGGVPGARQIVANGSAFVRRLAAGLRTQCRFVTVGSPQMEDIYRLRYDIYIKELKKSLPWADHQGRRLVDPDDRDAIHFVATRGTRIIGCVRAHVGSAMPQNILDAMGLSGFVQADGGRCAYVSRLMLERTARGRGAALKMMSTMAEFAATHGIDHVLFHCNAKLVHFYQRLGFQICGEPFGMAHSAMQTPMAVVWGDAEYLASVGSPLASHFRRYRLGAARLGELRAALFH